MNVRKKIWELLCEICIKGQYSNLLLRNQMNDYSSQDKALITHIVYGTLQNYRMVRFQWEHFTKKQPPEELCVLLDMSVYQLFFMEKMPAYAVVNEAVEIAKGFQASYAKMVNAVLHNVLRQGLQEPNGSEDEILSVRTSHPIWLIHMWNAQYGKDICRKICETNMQTHLPVARANTLKTTAEELMVMDDHFKKGRFVESALRYHSGNLASTTYYQDGLLAIQDEASQMVSLLLDPQPDEIILDVCSAPGTKATHMAQLMQNKGKIIAGDIHEHRVKLITEGAQRLGISILDARVMDALELPGLQSESYDRVLCDVPCSGYGVLGRKSDIKYHMQSSDMDTLIPLQQQILEKASTMVKPLGTLMYSTCTLNKKENEKQIEQFLKAHPQFTLLKEVTIFPFQYECDGFYMAKLQRNKRGCNE